MPNTPVVIVACAAKKHSLLMPRRADRLYISPLFTSSMAYARTLAPDEDIRILSAKHGLLALSDCVLPYDLRLGQKGEITSQAVALQLKSLLWRERSVVLLAGNNYSLLFECAWYLGYGLVPKFSRPMKGLRIGQQLAWLKNATKEAKS